MEFQQNGEIDIVKQMGTTNKQKEVGGEKQKTNTTNIESILNDSNYDNQTKMGYLTIALNKIFLFLRRLCTLSVQHLYLWTRK